MYMIFLKFQFPCAVKSVHIRNSGLSRRKAHLLRCHSCGGGCRGSALLTTPDDVMAPDRAICALYRGGYYDRVREVAQGAVAARSKGKALARDGEDDGHGRASLAERA